MPNQMAKVMARVWFIVLLKVWYRKCDIKISNVLNGYHFVKLLRGKTNKKTHLLDSSQEHVPFTHIHITNTSPKSQKYRYLKLRATLQPFMVQTKKLIISQFLTTATECATFTINYTKLYSAWKSGWKMNKEIWNLTGTLTKE